MIWIVLVVLVFVLALYMLMEKRMLPLGKITYNDVSRVEKPLYSKTLAIAGKPDFILKRGDKLIPVEYKSSKKPKKPYRSHILQLAAYCWLVEENYNMKCPYGYIIYGKTRFKVKYDDRLRRELMDTVGQMREFLKLSITDASQRKNERRCKSCLLREGCKKVIMRFTR
ncbi:MAG: CRISPR-associated protein Cas4 [Archaeoglobaceae archaeon]